MNPNLATKKLRRALPAASATIDAQYAIPAGKWTAHTSGLAPGNAQGNVVILPESVAFDFLRFCKRNPKPRPLPAVSEPGQPLLPQLGEAIDIRTDVPRYLLWKSGEIVAEMHDVGDLWRQDLVSFVLGCSLSFEHALIEAGIELRHVRQRKNVAIYKTNIEVIGSGPFYGPMVVSMRPLQPSDAVKAIQITSRMPAAHGAPVQVGTPEEIGVPDIGKPDFGDRVEVLPGELPISWACGVTAQAAVIEAKLEFCITHAPGCLLITDLPNSELRVS